MKKIVETFLNRLFPNRRRELSYNLPPLPSLNSELFETQSLDPVSMQLSLPRIELDLLASARNDPTVQLSSPYLNRDFSGSSLLLHDFNFWNNNQQSYSNPDVYSWREHNAHLILPSPDSNAEKLSSYEDLDIPKEFCCAISLQLMTDPVFDINCPQQKFERSVVMLWLEHNQINPCTRQPLAESDLVSDKDLKKRIDAFVTQTIGIKSNMNLKGLF